MTMNSFAKIRNRYRDTEFILSECFIGAPFILH